MPPSSFFFLVIALPIWGLLWFHTSLGIIGCNSLKDAIGILIEIAIDL